MLELPLLLLAVETALTAAGYATLGAALVGTSLRPTLVRLGVMLALQALLFALAGLALGLGVGAVMQVRTVVAAEALATFGLTRLWSRAGGPVFGAGGTTLAVMLLVLAPIPFEAISGLAGSAASSWRTVGMALSPLAAATQGSIDLLHLPVVYAYTPTAVMELSFVPWTFTALGWCVAGVTALLLSEWRRPKRGVTMLQRCQRSFSSYAAAIVLTATFCGCQRRPTPATVVEGVAVRPTAVAQPIDSATIKAAIDKGMAFLLSKRAGDGQIGGHPGVTALALLAVAHCPYHPGMDDPRVAPAIAALVKAARPDGAIAGPDYPAYTTALAILALQAFGAHPELVQAGQKWLAGQQAVEARGVDAKNVDWGGIGYGSKGNADLSNLHFALEALRDTQFKDHPEVFERAVKFIERCQNRSESNDQPWAGNDGGFVYRPGVSKAGGTLSTGSMTYAGINSFIYANVDKNDARVKDALSWIRANYTVNENPGLGQKGLYYYFHVMSQALSLLGEKTITDSHGVAHDWYAELATKVVSLQKEDGSWVNPDETYWESNPIVATARSVLALGLGYPGTTAAPR